jgi:hypothetical protein
VQQSISGGEVGNLIPLVFGAGHASFANAEADGCNARSAKRISLSQPHFLRGKMPNEIPKMNRSITKPGFLGSVCNQGEGVVLFCGSLSQDAEEAIQLEMIELV